jgi:hypothetical protein
MLFINMNNREGEIKMDKESKQLPTPLTEASASTTEEDIDLESMRISQDFPGMVSVKKNITNVPIRRPRRGVFFQVHPEADRIFETYLISDPRDGEMYGIVPDLAAELPDLLQPRRLYLCIDRQNSIFLWPVSLPRPDGQTSSWSESAEEAVRYARKNWIRIVGDRSAGAYVVLVPEAELPAPEWPDMDFDTILKRAFREKLIRDRNHPVFCHLKGLR